MRYTYAISALRDKDKYARLAGEIEAAERNTAKLRADMANIDATLRLFHPEADSTHITPIRPKWRGIYFRNGERTRLCLEALRDAGGPLRQGGIAKYVMRANGMDPADRPLRARHRQQRRGIACRAGKVGNRAAGDRGTECLVGIGGEVKTWEEAAS